MGRFGGLIKKLSNDQLVAFDASGTLELEGETFSTEEIEVLRETREGHDSLSNSLITIDLDCKLDQRLVNKGLAREEVNRIQSTRKDSGFQISDRIKVTFTADEDLANAILENKEYIMQETLSVDLSNESLSETVDFEIDGFSLKISLEVVS